MKTKHLLTALALPAIFAACTSEDIVQSENIVKEDLGYRPIVEDVTFSFTDAQSRAAIANWGTINFEEGDKVGVALIDIVSNAGAADPIARYNLLTQSINTNYIFTSDASGNFSSEAPMVEGNYAFYFPYNTQRTRGQILTNLPKEQALTMLEDGTYSSYPSVLEYSEENGAPIAVSYDFLSAADAGNTLEGTLKQIYATPLFTIQNGCTEKDADSDDVPVAMTIKQISLSYGTNGQFTLSAPLKFATAATNNAYTEAVAGNNTLVSNFFNETIPAGNNTTAKGSWNTAIKHRATSDLIGAAVSGGTSTEIILTLAEPVTVPAEGSFSFYAVIPAAVYTDTNVLSATVINGEGLSSKINFSDATLTAGQRYPEQEINDDNTLNDDIKGMSLTSVVEDFTALEGVLVSTVDEMINAIKNYKTAGELKIRVSEDAVINKRVADFLKLTTTKATEITFINDVTIEGPGVVLAPAKEINFSTKATAASSAAVTLNSTKVKGNLVIAAGATATYQSSTLTSITNNGTLIVEASTTADIQNNGVMNVTKSVNLTGTVKNGKYVSDSNYGGVAAELNVSADKTLNATSLTNAPDATINNLGTITGTSVVNKGEIVNGSEENINAVLNITSNDKVASKYTGSIDNYADATVATNNGDIEMMSVNAVLSAPAGNGKVVNDALAAVTAGSDIVVTYTISGTQTHSTIKPTTLINNGVTKVIFDGVVLNLGSHLDMLTLDVDVIANSSINSTGGAAAGYKFTLGTATKKAKLTISTNKKLTVNAGTILEGNYDVTGTIVNNGTVYEGVMIAGSEAEIKSAFTAALTAGYTKLNLAGELKLTEALTINNDVTIKGGTISGKAVNVTANAEVTFDGVKFMNPTNDTNKASGLYANGLTKSLTIKNCTFEGFQWDGVQIVPAATTTDAVITIENNTFVAPTTPFERYIHVECTAGQTNTVVRVIGNEFGSITNLRNNAIGIYNVAAYSNVYMGKNTFADGSETYVFPTGHPCVGEGLVFVSRASDSDHQNFVLAYQRAVGSTVKKLNQSGE